MLVLSVLLPNLAPLTGQAEETSHTLSLETANDYRLINGYVNLFDETNTYYDAQVDWTSQTIQLPDSINDLSSYTMEIVYKLEVGTDHIRYIDSQTRTGAEWKALNKVPWNSNVLLFSPNVSDMQEGVNLQYSYKYGEKVLNDQLYNEKGLLIERDRLVYFTLSGMGTDNHAYISKKTFTANEQTEQFHFSKEGLANVQLTPSEFTNLNSISISNWSAYFNANIHFTEGFSGNIFIPKDTYEHITLHGEQESWEVANPAITGNRTLSFSGSATSSMNLHFSQNSSSQSLNGELKVQKGDLFIYDLPNGKVEIFKKSDLINHVYSQTLTHSYVQVNDLMLEPGDYTVKVSSDHGSVTQDITVRKGISVMAPDGYVLDSFNQAVVSDGDNSEYVHGILNFDQLEDIQLEDSKRYKVQASFKLSPNGTTGVPLIAFYSQDYTGAEIRTLSSIDLKNYGREVEVKLPGSGTFSVNMDRLHAGSAGTIQEYQLRLPEGDNAVVSYAGEVDGKYYMLTKEIQSTDSNVNFTNEKNQAVKVSINTPFAPQTNGGHGSIYYPDTKLHVGGEMNNEFYALPGKALINFQTYYEKGQLFWRTNEVEVASGKTLEIKSDQEYSFRFAEQFTDQKGKHHLQAHQEVSYGDFLLEEMMSDKYEAEKPVTYKLKNSQGIIQTFTGHSIGWVHLELAEKLAAGAYTLETTFENPFTKAMETVKGEFTIKSETPGGVTVLSERSVVNEKNVNFTGKGPANKPFSLIAVKENQESTIATGQSAADGTFTAEGTFAAEGMYLVYVKFEEEKSAKVPLTVDLTPPVAPVVTVEKQTLSWAPVDPDAEYEVLQKNGDQWVSVAKNVTTPSYELKNLTAGGVYTFKVAATDAAGNRVESNEVEVKLDAVKVSGTVTAGQKALTETAVVILKTAEGKSVETVTSATGNFVFDSVPKGSYQVSVAYKSSFTDLPMAIKAETTDLENVTLDLPIYLDDVQFKVEDGAGQAVTENVRVSLTHKDTGKFFSGFVGENGLLTSWGGKKSFTQLPAGTYSYQVAAKGVYEATTGEVEVTDASKPFVIKVDKVAEKTNQLKLVVKNSNGEDLEGFTTTLSSNKVSNLFGYEKAFIEKKSMISGDSVDALAADDYQLTIRKSGFTTYNATVDLTENKELTIELQAARDVTGVVKTSADSVLAKGNVYVSGNNYSNYITTDSEGKFELKGIPSSGDLHFSIHAQGYKPFSQTMAAADLSNLIELTLEKDGSYLEITTVDTNEKPVPFTNIHVYDGEKYVTSEYTNRHGQLRISNLTQGKNYQLKVSAYDYPEFEKLVEFTTDGQKEKIVLSKQATDQLTGTLSGNSQIVAPGKTVKYRLETNNKTDVEQPINLTISENVVITEASIALNGKAVAKADLKAPKGESVITFEAKVKEAINDQDPIVHVTAKLGANDTEKVLSATTNILFVTLNAPAATGKAEIKVYGSAKPGTTVEVYDGDVRLATTKVEGRWWHADVKLPNLEASTHTLYAKVINGSNTYTSDPVQVDYQEEIPVITGVNVNAGWNKNVKLNPNVGIATMAISENMPINVKLAFDKEVDEASIDFIGKTVKMTKNGNEFTGIFPGPWASFGEQLFEVVYKKGDKEYRVPLIEVLVLIDPSGFVFEGSMENRLEGVTATVFQGLDANENAALASADVKNWKEWDAEKYGQINNQVTNDEGRYGWDVPQGVWQVKFVKPAYEDYASRFVTVPPPETQLNVPLVQTSAPKIIKVIPANDATNVKTRSSITIEFDRLVAIEDLSTMIEVKKGNESIAGMNVATQEFYGYKETEAGFFEEDPTKKLAKSITFKPDAAWEKGQSYKFSVSDQVVDYAGKPVIGTKEFTFTTEAATSNPGSGGGGGVVTPEPPAAGKPEFDEKTGEQQLRVDEKQVEDQIKDEKAKSVVIEVPENKEAKSYKAVVGQAVLEKAAASKKPVVISAAGVELSFTAATLKAMTEKAGEEISFVIAPKTAVAGDLPQLSKKQTFASALYDFSITTEKSGKATSIATSKDPVQVTVPVKNVKDARKAAAYYLNEQAKKWEYQGGRVKNGEMTFTVNHFSKYAVIEQAKTFSDVQSASTAWGRDYIEVLASRSIINGKTPDHFAPNDQITRAQFAMLLARALQLPVRSYEGIFPDVTEKQMKEAAMEVEAASRAGIITGHNGKFKPYDKITRQQMAAMIIRAIEYKQPEALPKTVKEANFVDQADIYDYAKPHVNMAAQLGIISGREQNGKKVFAPNEHASRIQAAKLLYNALEIIEK